MTESRTRFDLRLSRLGPDILAPEAFETDRFLARLRAGEPGRELGDALLDQSVLAGVGNIWKSEGCWEAQLNPRRSVASIGDDDARRIVERIRPRMLESGLHGPQRAESQVYKRTGRPCPRCGTPIVTGLAGDGARTTYWCPGCQI